MKRLRAFDMGATLPQRLTFGPSLTTMRPEIPTR